MILLSSQCLQLEWKPSLNGTVHKQVEFMIKNHKWHGTKSRTCPSSGPNVLHESYLRKTVLKISGSGTKSLWGCSLSKERSLICRIPESFDDVICLKPWICRIS
jgi:hypothetical protein